MPSKDAQRPSFGSIALLFVHPDYRGLGIGSELFDKVMKSERFKDINIYITSVPHMTAKYRTRYGFDKQPTWRHNFYKIRILNIEKVATEITNLDIRYASVSSLNENEWQQLLEYDANIVGGIERAKYIRLILNVKTSTSMVAFDVNDKVIAICSVRELTEPKTIMAGPWFAETLDIAESLLRRVLASACERASYEHIVFAIPSNNSSGIELIKRIGKNEVEEIDVYCPQFNKEVIEVITHKIFSGADPDLLII
ncbi:acetyltransferase (GNAT) domain-containing protein [Ditylenchus destructor]|nr:acetyltransferase (GNAT) domain-containing protein [Ditylenchus destructor]